MKVTFNGSQSTPKFPYVGESTKGYIVLFSAKGCGICLAEAPAATVTVGEYYTRWQMEHFKRLNGKVTLEND